MTLLVKLSKMILMLSLLLNLDNSVLDWFEALGYLIASVTLIAVVLKGTR